MEQNFQTSFIPKKTISQGRAPAPYYFGFISIISIFIFLTMLVAAAGLYFYKGIMTKSISSMEVDLNLAKNRFEPSKIQQLQVLDKRLRAADSILSKHIAVTPIFEALEGVTMKSVRFTKFSYILGDETNPNVQVKMSGIASGYRSVALQADLFSKKEDFIDPIFSNLSLDDKGNVLFDLDFSVLPSFINYESAIKAGTALPQQPTPIPLPGEEIFN